MAEITRQKVTAARRDVAIFAKLLIGQELWPHQLDLARSTARISAACSGRQAGKSTVLAVTATHEAFRAPDRRVLIVSAGESAALDLLAQVSTFASSPLLAGSVVDDERHQITLSNGSVIRSVPASEKQIRGRAADLLIIDEAAFVSEEIFTAARYVTIARPGSRIILASTPWGRQDRFFATAYRAGQRHEDGYASFHWPSTSSPLVDAELLEMWEASIPDREFRREILAEWVDSQGAYFSDEELEAAVVDYELIPPERADRRRAVAGVDWGFLKDSSAVVVLAEAVAGDLPPEWPEHTFFVPWVHEGVHVPYATFVARVAEVARGYRLHRIASECNGVGMMPTAELSTLLRFRFGKVIAVTTTAASKEDGFGTMKVMLGQGRLALPRHPGLLAQLGALEYEERDTGTLKIAVPERAGHDDICMALMLAMGVADVASRSTGGRIYMPTGDLPPIRLTPDREKHEPPPAVVREGEERPVDKLRHFQNARRHAAYQPPGTWQR